MQTLITTITPAMDIAAMPIDVLLNELRRRIGQEILTVPMAARAIYRHPNTVLKRIYLGRLPAHHLEFLGGRGAYLIETTVLLNSDQTH